MGNRKTWFQSILSAADFPGEILTGVPVIEIKGEAEAVVIHHRGILRYDDEEVCISSAIGPVSVRGAKLKIVRMNRERLILRGRIISVRIGEGSAC